MADGVQPHQNAVKGVPVKAVATDLLNVLPYAVVSLEKTNIRTVKDLEGKALAITPGDGLTQTWPAVVAANKLNPDSIKLIHMDPKARDIPAVTEKQAHALLGGADDQAVTMEVKGFKTRTLKFSELGVPSVGFTVFAHQDTIKDRARTWSGRSWPPASRDREDALKDPDAAVAALVKIAPLVDRETIRRQLAVDLGLLFSAANKEKRLGFGPPEDWAATLDVLKKYRGVETNLPPTAFYTNEFLVRGSRASAELDGRRPAGSGRGQRPRVRGSQPGPRGGRPRASATGPARGPGGRAAAARRRSLVPLQPRQRAALGRVRSGRGLGGDPRRPSAAFRPARCAPGDRVLHERVPAVARPGSAEGRSTGVPDRDHRSLQDLRGVGWLRPRGGAGLAGRAGGGVPVGARPVGLRGKSTLMLMIAGLLPPSSGEIRIAGHPVTRPQTDVGIVFQSPVLLDWRTVIRNVLLQVEARGLDGPSHRVKARELLQAVGLEGFEDRYPFELSGGMRQRAAICRALIHDPPLLLMDEPFGALDALTREQMRLDIERLRLGAGRPWSSSPIRSPRRCS